MAKIEEQFIVIKMSKLVRDDAVAPSFVVGGEVVDSLATIVDEIIGDSSIITEVTRGE